MKMKNWLMIIGITVAGILAYFGFKRGATKQKSSSRSPKKATLKKGSEKVTFARPSVK